MSKKVLILDTSVLCCWLQVPGKEHAGPDHDKWDYQRISSLLDREEKDGSTFVLPMASLIETGNHIAQCAQHRYETARKLAQYLIHSTDGTSPWAAFTEQAVLWGMENLRRIAQTWPSLAAQRLTIGDATIKDVAEYYARAGYLVEILTGDNGLKAYQPATPLVPPRRRGSRR
jgi:hypothetical protein